MGPMGPAPRWGSVWGGAEEEPSLAPLYQARARHRALFAAVTSPGRSNGESWDQTPNHTVLGEFRHFSPLLDAGLGREGAGGAAPQLCPLTCPSPVLFPDNLHRQGRKGRCWAAALRGGNTDHGPPLCSLQLPPVWAAEDGSGCSARSVLSWCGGMQWALAAKPNTSAQSPLSCPVSLPVLCLEGMTKSKGARCALPRLSKSLT